MQLRRFPLLLLLVLGLALGPFPVATACAVDHPQTCASACCSGAEASCCEAAQKSAPESPVPAAPSSAEGKQLVAPLLVVVWLRPEIRLERPTSTVAQQFGFVAAPRVAVTCIRLI